MNRPSLKLACEEIDAEIFSGDVLFNDNDRKELLEYVTRWAKAIEDFEKSVLTDKEI